MAADPVQDAPMRIAVTGATGTIGRALVTALLERGADVVALSRDSGRARQALGERVRVEVWADPLGEPPPVSSLAGADGVVHLLGEPVAQRWTSEARRRIESSRVLSTRRLADALAELPESERPGVLVSQSATGFYGPRGEDAVDEAASPGDDFLARVTVAWEREAERAASAVRLVTTRTGVVLSPAGGALAKMLPFFRLGLGGPVAGGRQFVPWIHLDDVVGATIRCLEDERAVGPVNLTAPTPVTNSELARELGRALGRPAVLPVPGLAVRLLYGEMAEMVSDGQRVLPSRLRELGYEFAFPELAAALEDVLGRR